MLSSVLTLVLASSEGGKPSPVAHVVNHAAVKGDLFGLKDVWMWSGHIGNLLLAGLILCIVGPWVARHIATGPESQGTKRYVTRNKFAHMIEVVCVYLRENTVRPLLGGRTDGFMPFLWTIFFFIWVNNLLGMLPLLDVQELMHHWSAAAGHGAEGVVHELQVWFGGTATQSVFTTGVLALISFLVVNISGIRELGIGGYLKHLTGGAPVFIWPILVPVEIMGTFIKPVALALRLFANMTAGHILLAALLGFVATGVVTLAGGGMGNVLMGGTVSIVAGLGAIAIFFLEVFVATLQAFIFMFLTTVFISQLSHHHDHDHEHEHGHGHGHEHAHA